MLREVPFFDRPREKALKYGIKTLSTVELIAIMLRTGSKDEGVIDLSKRLLYGLDSLSRLREMTIEELVNLKGIGKTKAITLLASIELGLRILEDKNRVKAYSNPKQIFDYYSPLLKNINKECLYAIYLNTKGYVISEQLITQGTITLEHKFKDDIKGANTFIRCTRLPELSEALSLYFSYSNFYPLVEEINLIKKDIKK